MDLEKLKANIPSEDILRAIPIFNKKIMVSVDGELKELDKTKVIEYISYVYSNNELSRTYKNFLRRKMEAAKIADFPTNRTKRFLLEYDNIILNKNKYVNKMIVAYLSLFNSSDYKELVVYRDLLDSELWNLKNLAGESGEDKNKAIARNTVMNNIDKIKETIKKLEKQFLMKDDSRDLLSVMYEEMSLEDMAFTPEEIAEKLLKGEEPLGGFTPYEFK